MLIVIIEIPAGSIKLDTEKCRLSSIDKLALKNIDCDNRDNSRRINKNGH